MTYQSYTDKSILQKKDLSYHCPSYSALLLLETTNRLIAGHVIEISKKEQLIIVFDEFQNFKYVDPSNFSTIQKHWDQNYKASKLNLIFIGSIISLMEKIFRGSKEPLFGRANHKIYLEPFDFLTVENILKDHKKKYAFSDLLNFWTVFGGIPKYYAELENQDQFKETLAKS